MGNAEEALNAIELATEYVKARNEYLDSKAVTDALATKQKLLEARLIAKLVSDGLKSFQLEGLGYTVGYVRSSKVSCLAANMDLLEDWLRKVGSAGLIKSKIDMRSLATTVRELREAGEEIPEFVEEFDHLSISMRKI